MTFRKLGTYLFGVSFLFTFAACTGSNTDEQTNTELLASQSIFSQEATLASFSDPDGITAFDDNNRPIVDGAVLHCPDPDDPPPISCEEGFELQGDECVIKCNVGQVSAQGKCYDKEKTCDVENGDGIQEWMANTYGSCTPTTCNDGYKLNDTKCVARCKDDEIYDGSKCKPVIADCKHEGRTGVKIWRDAGYGKCHISRNCKMPDGKGMKRYNVQTLLYDNCEVTTCDHGFSANNSNKRCDSICAKGEVYNGKKCLPETRDCQVAGGSGQRIWNTNRQRYGWCTVTRCNFNFERRGNSCRRRVREGGGGGEGGGGEGDPLVVDLGSDINNAQGITLTSQLQGILFDILGLNSMPNPNDKKQISWTQDQRYQFVVKPDQNGQVSGIDQMFGDNTLGPDGKFSAEGFEALGKYDTDKNGIIDTEDTIYGELALWHDANGNGVSDAGELTSFAGAGIASIDLNFDPNFFEVDQYGNKTTYKSIVKFDDGKRSLIFDLWFQYLEPPVVTPPVDPPPIGECPVAKVASN